MHPQTHTRGKAPCRICPVFNLASALTSSTMPVDKCVGCAPTSPGIAVWPQAVFKTLAWRCAGSHPCAVAAAAGRTAAPAVNTAHASRMRSMVRTQPRCKHGMGMWQMTAQWLMHDGLCPCQQYARLCHPPTQRLLPITAAPVAHHCDFHCTHARPSACRPAILHRSSHVPRIMAAHLQESHFVITDNL